MPRLSSYCKVCRLPVSGHDHKACREERKLHGKDAKLRCGECDIPGCGAKKLGVCMTFVLPCDHRYCYNCAGFFRRTTHAPHGLLGTPFCIVCGKKVKSYFG